RLGPSCVFLLTEERIIIDQHLRVRGLHLPVCCQSKRVDLSQAGITLDEGSSKCHQKSTTLADHVMRQSGASKEIASLEGTQPPMQIDRLLDDLLRRGCCYLFDV